MPTVGPTEIKYVNGKKLRGGDEYTDPTPKAAKAPEAKKADNRKDGK